MEKLIGWVLWLLLLLLALSWLRGVRRYVSKGESVSYYTIIQTTFLWVILLTFLFASLNKLHILWVTPLAFFGTYVLLAIPVLGGAILSISKIFTTIMCTGVKK